MDIKTYIERYKRVLKLLKRPTREEFIAGIKIAGIGLLLVGFIGFVIWYVLIHLLKIGI